MSLYQLAQRQQPTSIMSQNINNLHGAFAVMFLRHLWCPTPLEPQLELLRVMQINLYDHPTYFTIPVCRSGETSGQSSRLRSRISRLREWVGDMDKLQLSYK